MITEKKFSVVGLNSRLKTAEGRDGSMILDTDK